jgi:MFS family permease
LTMIENTETSLKPSALSALALAFASFGDAFLYPFLPVNFGNVGVPVMWVGLLLSINRFVRIFSNTMIVHALAKYGLRSIMIVAVLMAILSTLGYAVADGLVVWVLFRITWGLSFSAMRIGTLGYALQHERMGLSLGVSKSLQEAGPMLSLFLAPVLLQYFDSNTIFYVLALLSLPALYFALKLPIRHDKIPALQAKGILHWPTTLNAITLVTAIVIDGIIVVVLGILLLHYRHETTLINATTLAAFYLGYRRVCLVVLSPAGGWIADKIGLDRIFIISTLLLIAGLITIISGWIGTGAVIVFTFYSINAAITPGFASTTGSHPLAAVAENATWRDIGAAVGTLIGGLLISSAYLNAALLGATFVMTILLIAHTGNSRKALKPLFLWK